MANNQIKARSRVQEYGEVFTAEREVNAMLNLVAAEVESIDSTFLEPACGDGNFLIEILNRKLDTVFTAAGKNDADCEYLATRAISTIYGIDILPDNITEARERLYYAFLVRFVNTYKHQPTKICRDSVGFILSQNIQCGNTLTATDCTGSPLTITQWSFDDTDGLRISIYDYAEMIQTGCKCPPIKTLPKISYLMLPAIIR